MVSVLHGGANQQSLLAAQRFGALEQKSISKTMLHVRVGRNMKRESDKSLVLAQRLAPKTEANAFLSPNKPTSCQCYLPFPGAKS